MIGEDWWIRGLEEIGGLEDWRRLVDSGCTSGRRAVAHTPLQVDWRRLVD